MSSQPSLDPQKPRRGLSLWDASSIVVGTIIGAAIFQMPTLVAQQVDSLPWLIAAWLIGGLIAFSGALCFAELTTTYNEDGGDYIYLKHAFGRYMAFLFAWTAGWIIRPANIAAMAVTFAKFAENAFPSLSALGSITVAMIAVIVIFLLNLQGIQTGRITQNLLTTAKVIGLLLLVTLGFWPSSSAGPSAPPASTPAAVVPAIQPMDASIIPQESETVETLEPVTSLSRPSESDAVQTTEARPLMVRLQGLLMALVFVLYTFGGWNDVSFISAEVQNPQRNLPRALLLGLTLVTLIYLLVNASMLRNLGLTGLASAENAPNQIVSGKLADWNMAHWGSALLGLMVSVSCLGAVNAMLITSPRIYYAAGQDHRWLAWFASWNHEKETPVRALAAQTVATIVILLACAGLNSQVLSQLGWDTTAFQRRDPFAELVSVSSPFFWLFLALVGMGLMVLRYRDPHRHRPFRTPLFPLTPLIFVLSSLFMVYSSFHYAFFVESYLVSGGLVLLVFCAALLFGWQGFITRPADTNEQKSNL